MLCVDKFMSSEAAACLEPKFVYVCIVLRLPKCM